MPEAQEKGLVLKVDLPDPGLVIDTDRSNMGHLLANLLSNAIRFTDQGWVMVRAYGGEGRAWVEVQDTGSGISETFRPRLFDELERESSAVLRRHQGPGLGSTFRLSFPYSATPMS